MDINNIADMSRQELLECISSRKNEIAEKLKNGETEESFAIGGKSYTNKEWDNLLKKIDTSIEAVKEEQKERKEKLEKEREQETLLTEVFKGESTKTSSLLSKLNGTYKGTVPYGYLAEDGVITYNGVIFVCDEQKNAICLGDMSDKGNVLTIPLSGGGSLMVNRNNLGDLSQAISMFSPEDINRILRAIADDNKAQEAQRTLDEESDSIGDDAEQNLFDEDAVAELLADREAI